MANHLKREKQIDILRLLVEGNSSRSTERLTGVHRDTICRVLVRFGTIAKDWLDLNLCNLSLDHVEIDEIWTFVRKKQKMLHGWEIIDPEIGDIYVFTAIDQKTKLMASFALGKRNMATTRALIADLQSRMVRRPDSDGEDRPQLSTDGFGAYPSAIRESFGQTVKHGVLIKNYVNPEVGRYAPPKLLSVDRIGVQLIEDVATICTSHVERHNLTLRTFMKRFTRLSLGFSKKLENLAAAMALQVAYYNFCWRLREKGKSGRLTPTPAMQAGLTDTLWNFENLFDAITEFDKERNTMAKYRKLADKIGKKR